MCIRFQRYYILFKTYRMRFCLSILIVTISFPRISVIFRVRSAKAVKITDLNLMKRLGIIVAVFSVLLMIRTLVAPPIVIVGRTADDLKAFLCRTDWWDHSFTTSMYFAFRAKIRNNNYLRINNYLLEYINILIYFQGFISLRDTWLFCKVCCCVRGKIYPLINQRRYVTRNAFSI